MRILPVALVKLCFGRGALLLVAYCAWTTPGAAAVEWYVQLPSEEVDAATVRRTIALELAEVDIPPDPRHPGETGYDVSLHIDVKGDGERLIVTMFDRGELIGRRTISASGQPKIVARRVGLAVSELARELREHRLRMTRELEAEQRLADKRATLAAYRVQQQALGITAGVNAQGYLNNAYLLGPVIGLEFNDHFPLRFSLSAGWYAGGVGALSGEQDARVPHWSKWEMQWGAHYVAQLRMRSQFSIGANFAASALHLGNGGVVDNIPGQQDTWSAQLGLVAGLSFLPQPQLATRFLLEAGRVLRPIPMSWAGQEQRLGGFYLSGTMSVALFP